MPHLFKEAWYLLSTRSLNDYLGAFAKFLSSRAHARDLTSDALITQPKFGDCQQIGEILLFVQDDGVSLAISRISGANGNSSLLAFSPVQHTSGRRLRPSPEN